MSASPTHSARSPIAAFVSDDASLATLRDYAAKNGWATDHLIKGTIDDAAAYLRAHIPPDILIVEVASPAEAPAQLDGLAELCDAHVKVLVTSTINEFSFYRWLIDIGIHGYLLKPFGGDAIDAIIHKQPVPTTPAEANKPGIVTTVIGARGGVGATTIATNLGYALAHISGKQSAVMDFDPQLGSVALALDLEPTRGLRDAFEKPDRIDSIFLDRLMSRYDDLFSVLGVEEALEEQLLPNPQAAEALIREARKKFAHVVIDLPRSINAFTKHTLKASDHVILVTELTLAGLRDSMRLMDFCRNNLKITPPLLVSNREGAAGAAEMTRNDFEKNLNAKIMFHIPSSSEAYAAAATGEVLIESAPKSSISNVINNIAAHISGETLAAAHPSAKAPLWKKLLGDKKK